jgi:signal transduction histidine kinase
MAAINFIHSCTIRYKVVLSRSLYFLLLLLCATGAVAQIRVTDSFKKASLQYVQVMEDTSHNINVAEVVNGQYDSRFVPSKEEVLNFRYSTSTWWIKFKVKNEGTNRRRLVLGIASSNINQLSLYMAGPDSLMQQGPVGLDYPYDEEKIVFGDYAIPIIVEPGKEYTCYMQVRNRMASLRLPMKIWDGREFLRSHQAESIGWGVFMGIMLLIALFNIMVFGVLRDRVYLYYFIYVIALLVYQLSGKGLFFQYLWPGNPWINESAIIMFSILLVVSMLKFSQSFLEMPVKFPKVNPYINALMILMLVYIPICFMRDIPLIQPVRMPLIQIFTFTPIIGILIMLASLVKGLREKHWASRMYVVAFTPLVLFSIAIALRNNHLIPYFPFFDVRIPLSFSFELIVFSFALAYRFKVLKDQQAHLLMEINEQRIQQFKAVIEATENERKRIAQDLHDGLGQLLSTAKLNVSSLEDSIVEDDRKQYENSMSLIDEACQEVRSISHNMMPSTLIRLGLLPAIKELADKINSAQQVRVEVTLEGFESRLNEEREIAIYRIVQEVLNNALKYAAATLIKIMLVKRADEVVVTINDNGKGFNTDNIAQSKGIGWRNVFSRVDMLGGHINVHSTEGKGTTVVVRLLG